MRMIKILALVAACGAAGFVGGNLRGVSADSQVVSARGFRVVNQYGDVIASFGAAGGKRDEMISMLSWGSKEDGSAIAASNDGGILSFKSGDASITVACQKGVPAVVIQRGTSSRMLTIGNDGEIKDSMIQNGQPPVSVK